MNIPAQLRPLMARALAYAAKHRLPVAAAAAVFIVLLLLIFSPGDAGAIATSEVRRGPFVVSIKSSGEIRAANSFTLTTPRVRWGQMQIVFLVPEGNTVKQGDVVVRFATTEVDKNIADKESELNILKSDLAKFHADKALRDAELEGGLRNAELAFDQAKLQVEKMKFEAEVQRKEAEINLEKSRLAFDQAKRKIQSQAMVDKSEERKLALKIQQTQRDIDGAKRDKEEYTLKAARGGLVVYEMNWSTNRKINVGDNPWPGMPVVSLPDLSRMQSVSSINEVDISKVRKDQKCSVRLDAFPDREFTGTVAVVGTIGQQKDRQSAIKTFEVVIDLDGTDPILKPGMTTSNEIVQQTLPDTTFIPIESVFEREGKSIVYRMSGSRARPVEITLGTKNSNYVVIAGGGLNAGDRVTLRDPNAGEGREAVGKESPGPQASKSTEKPS